MDIALFINLRYEDKPCLKVTVTLLSFDNCPVSIDRQPRQEGIKRLKPNEIHWLALTIHPHNIGILAYRKLASQITFLVFIDIGLIAQDEIAVNIPGYGTAKLTLMHYPLAAVTCRQNIAG